MIKYEPSNHYIYKKKENKIDRMDGNIDNVTYVKIFKINLVFFIKHILIASSRVYSTATVPVGKKIESE